LVYPERARMCHFEQGSYAPACETRHQIHQFIEIVRLRASRIGRIASAESPPGVGAHYFTGACFYDAFHWTAV
jgi:hypothetical protein